MTGRWALIRFLACFAGAFAISAASIAAGPKHDEQAPGYFRVKVGAFEVTSLFDGAGAFQLDWLKGKPDELKEIGGL